jgi:hypothetical protein
MTRQWQNQSRFLQDQWKTIKPSQHTWHCDGESEAVCSLALILKDHCNTDQRLTCIGPAEATVIIRASLEHHPFSEKDNCGRPQHIVASTTTPLHAFVMTVHEYAYEDKTGLGHYHGVCMRLHASRRSVRGRVIVRRTKIILKSWLEPAIAVPRSALPFPQTYYQQGPTSTSLSHLLLLQFKPRDSVHYWIQVLCLPLLDVSNSGAECQRTHEASCQPLSISESRLHRCSSISPSQFLIKFLCLLWLPHKSLVTYVTDCTDRVERAGVARLRQ